MIKNSLASIFNAGVVVELRAGKSKFKNFTLAMEG
jgi:hypothetical protein